METQGKKRKSNSAWAKFWRVVKECFLHSLMPAFMYVAMSGLLLIILQRHADDNGNVARNTVIVSSIICGALGVIYNGLMAWACGGTHFEQLVSGNMKRRSAEELGSDLTIRSYKSEKEYRPWKGFAMGAFTALPILIGGLLFGAHQAEIDAGKTTQGVAIFLLIFDFLAGWAIIPFQYLKSSNLYISILFVLVPIIISGAFYIVGAYSRRASIAKKQALADRKSAEQEAKPKKINYGGLPGTKPNKKK